MGEVVSLADHAEANSPHASGEALCTACGYRWVAVAPVGTTWLQCPECETLRGLYKHPMLSFNDEPVWTCACSGEIFLCTPSGIFCCGCGVAQVFP